MVSPDPQGQLLTTEGVQADLQRQQHLLVRLAENALTVAESLRDNYFKNTATFVADLRRTIRAADRGQRAEPILAIHSAADVGWAEVQGEVVTFIDGGVAQVEISRQMPILLRVGSYQVRTGERRLGEREQFGYYPVILGALEGGSKNRPDFPEVIRITAELLAGLSVLERTPDLRVLMFHGPLVYPMGHYAGHTPFTEKDIDLLLHHYVADAGGGRQLKEHFLREAHLDIYPRMTDRADDWARRRLFEPLAWIAFLYRRMIEAACRRQPVPIIAGVVERGRSSDFSREVLLPRIFRGLRDRGKADYFNRLFGRSDLSSPQGVLERLGYTDTLLLATVLEPGRFSEPWEVAIYEGLTEWKVSLPDEPGSHVVNFGALRPGPFGFPVVRACYVRASETTEPIRVEVFADLGPDQIVAAARRAYLYARLLPGYGFPVGLDVADRFARVPDWLTRAYCKLIRHHLGVSLQRGEVSDAEMRKLLVQAMYMTHRDWLFRPRA